MSGAPGDGEVFRRDLSGSRATMTMAVTTVANDAVMEWNQQAATRAVIPTLAPVQQNRVMAIVQVAVHDAVTGLSSRTIHRLVEAGEVHFAETPAGALLICPNSVGSNSERKIYHAQ